MFGKGNEKRIESEIGEREKTWKEVMKRMWESKKERGGWEP